MSPDLLLNIAIQVVSLGFFGGILWTKVSQLEQSDAKLEQEIRDFRELKEDLAVMRSELKSINACMNRLVAFVERNSTYEINAIRAHPTDID